MGTKKPKLAVLPYRHHKKYKFVLDLRAFGKGRKFFKTRAEADAEPLRQIALKEQHTHNAIGLSTRDVTGWLHSNDFRSPSRGLVVGA